MTIPRVIAFVAKAGPIEVGDYAVHGPASPLTYVHRFSGGLVPETTAFRLLPPNWLEKAVERLQPMCELVLGPVQYQPRYSDTEILAAILGPEPSPEPEPEDVELAQAWWEQARARNIVTFRTDALVGSVARAIAAARRKSREKP